METKIITSAPPFPAAEDDPYQELAEQLTAVDDARVAERRRCSAVVQEALDLAAMRGLPENSPVVRILAGIKHAVEMG